MTTTVARTSAFVPYLKYSPHGFTADYCVGCSDLVPTFRPRTESYVGVTVSGSGCKGSSVSYYSFLSLRLSCLTVSLSTLCWNSSG